MVQCLSGEVVTSGGTAEGGGGVAAVKCGSTARIISMCPGG